MKPRKLFTPGPTEVPPRVLETLSRPLFHHRTEEFRAIHRETVENLRYVYRTQNPVLILTSSGSGAMEAAVANLTKPGEKVIVTELGKFSERWTELAQAYGLDVVVVQVKWGDPVPPERIEEALEANPDTSVFFTTHCETSTGVLQDVKSMSRIAHQYGALVVVDGITSLCAQVVETDDWNLDVVVGGSQKGFMTPPGLSFLSISEAARERMERARHPVYYFDLNRALKAFDKGDTPWTPAHTLIIALNEALKMIREEGLEAVIRRHTRNAKSVRYAVRSMGLELFSSSPCNATTAVLPAEGTANAIREHLESEYGIKVAGGQGPLKGKIVRLGHLGYYHETDMYALVAALEGTLYDLGVRDSMGKGTEALLHHFRNE